MKFLEFKALIHSEFKRIHGTDSSKFIPSINEFLSQVEAIPLEPAVQAMTSLTILFEGFYQSTSDPLLNELMLTLRAKRWNSHYSTPTISFLLTYDKEIKATRTCFQSKFGNLAAIKHDSVIKDGPSDSTFATKPWLVNLSSKETIIDESNNLTYEPSRLTEAIESVEMPSENERPGIFIKTHNPIGGFTTAPSDEFSKEFISYATSVCERGGRIIEFGAGFGAASLQVNGKGGQIFINDIEPRNLAVVLKRFTKAHGITISASALTGDAGTKDTTGQLINLPGALPKELAAIPDESLDAILINRVIHFFTGKTIEECFQLFAKKLKPGGMLFITCETPYLGNWTKFTPEYNTRRSTGAKWPGEITEPAKYESSGFAASLPAFMHLIGIEELKTALENSGFQIKKISYINRANQFVPALLLDGRESVGAAVMKPKL